jgi:hypothetical protein
MGGREPGALAAAGLCSSQRHAAQRAGTSSTALLLPFLSSSACASLFLVLGLRCIADVCRSARRMPRAARLLHGCGGPSGTSCSARPLGARAVRQRVEATARRPRGDLAADAGVPCAVMRMRGRWRSAAPRGAQPQKRAAGICAERAAPAAGTSGATPRPRAAQASGTAADQLLSSVTVCSAMRDMLTRRSRIGHRQPANSSSRHVLARTCLAAASGRAAGQPHTRAARAASPIPACTFD